jgi:O-antigen/teichoic acid export membrane protein
MSLLKSLSLMSFSNAVRLGAAFITFATTARVLGPERFGVLMFCLSAASLLSIASNFGLVTFLLREIGQRPDQSVKIIKETLSAKIIASTLTILLGIAVIPILIPPSHSAYLLLLVAMIAEGYTEFFNTGFRASNRFDIEARLAFISAWIYSLTVGLVAWWTASLEAIAGAYLFSRLLITFLTWRELSREIGTFRPASLTIGWARLCSTLSYAIDAALSSAFGQIDSVFLNHFLGPIAVGIHQAGMRLFLAGAQAAPILANVFLPRVSAANSKSLAIKNLEVFRLQISFLGVGASFGFVLTLAGHWIVDLLFGDDFSSLAELMPWFGLLFAVRFSAISWGIQLTAQGSQRYRAIASTAHWILIGLSAVWLIPIFNNTGWLISLAIGNLFLCTLYAFKAMQYTSSDAKIIGITIIMLVAFLPTLKLP